MEKTQNKIPAHLRQYIADQDYSLYTPIDQASWRYIMRVSRAFFKTHAHSNYVEGLEATGITIDHIPKISDMDKKLQKLGWRAAVITGFIPTEAFLEMQASQILPIACDMRKLEHIDYTPAPDIVHEAAGHAPMLANPSYSSYLRKFGETARKVIFAKEDNEVYEAILNLSEIKEDPFATVLAVQEAEENLRLAYSKVSYVSEAQQLSRLGWWSTEYGLFKKDDQFFIYGAGLLSSVGESYACLSPEVKKIPLTLACIETDYDITQPQPQLFYTEDFKDLESVIDQLAERMAFRRGGIEGLQTALKAQTVVTIEFESGIQLSGILKHFQHAGENINRLLIQVPLQVSIHNERIFDIRGRDEAEVSVHCGAEDSFSGTRLLDPASHALLGVVDGNEIKISATRVRSVFGGAADRVAFIEDEGPVIKRPRPQKSNLTEDSMPLMPLYARVREIRETRVLTSDHGQELIEMNEVLNQNFPEDWLLRLEILEIWMNNDPGSPQIPLLRSHLEDLSQKSGRLEMLIRRGFECL